jgi:hypothetical protein
MTMRMSPSADHRRLFHRKCCEKAIIPLTKLGALRARGPVSRRVMDLCS